MSNDKVIKIQKIKDTKVNCKPIYLEGILMANGEIFSSGKCLGHFKTPDIEKYAYEEIEDKK